jgi:hypothetical protein
MALGWAARLRGDEEGEAERSGRERREDGAGETRRAATSGWREGMGREAEQQASETRRDTADQRCGAGRHSSNGSYDAAAV